MIVVKKMKYTFQKARKGSSKSIARKFEIKGYKSPKISMLYIQTLKMT